MTDSTTNPPLKRCTKCGEEKPATTDYFARNNRNGKQGFQPKCKKCNKLYVEANKDRIKAYCQAQYTKNKSTIIARQKTRREQINRVRRALRQRNPEAMRMKEREYKDKNREKIRIREREYFRRNPYAKRTIDNRRAAKKRQSEATLSVAQWVRCLEYFNHQCAVCGRHQGLWHVIAQDHWIALSLGGATTATNIIPLCHARKDGTDGCNQSKKDKTPEAWLEAKYGKHKAKQILAKVNVYFEWVNQQD